MVSSFLLTSTATAEIELQGARVRAPIPGQEVTAGYLQITNLGSGPRVLIGVSSTEADRVEIHQTRTEDGMMQMQQLDTVALPGGETVTFAEGSTHLMIFALSADAIEASEIPLLFQFEDGETLKVHAVINSLFSANP